MNGRMNGKMERVEYVCDALQSRFQVYVHLMKEEAERTEASSSSWNEIHKRSSSLFSAFRFHF